MGGLIFPTFKVAHHLFDKFAQKRLFLLPSLYSSCYTKLSCSSHFLSYPVRNYGEYDKEVRSRTSVISGLVKMNRPEEAISRFKLMLVHEVRPNYVTVLSVLRAVGLVGSESLVLGLHGMIIKMGLEVEVSVATALIGVYGDYDMVGVRRVFYGIPFKDLVIWSAMVSICVKNGECEEAIEVFRGMICEGIKPNSASIVSILPACGRLGALRFGKEVHGYVLKTPLCSLIHVQNSLLDMYAKCGDLNYCGRVFAGVRSKDLVTWKTMIHGCVENDCPRKALSFFIEMQLSHFELDDAVLCDVITAASDAEEIRFGLGLHCLNLKSGYTASILIGTTLMQMYAKFGLVNSAGHLFNQLQPKDLIAWSAMISAYTQCGYASEALATFDQMQLANEKPNDIAYVGILQACSLSGAQNLGESIHGFATKAGYLQNTCLISTLIDFYCKFGRIKQGRALFDESTVKDLILWSSMINGYGLNGCGDEALETFSIMLASGIMPNDVVFVSVLSACSHSGLEGDGWYWFNYMQEYCGIKPKLAHYACMIDLLSRRGRVKEALEFVYSMPVEPDKRIWGSLLAGCRSTRGSLEVAEHVVERLVQLDPENTSYFVVLSNLYADEGRWDDVEQVRLLIDENGMEKKAAYSTV